MANKKYIFFISIFVIIFLTGCFNDDYKKSDSKTDFDVEVSSKSSSFESFEIDCGKLFEIFDEARMNIYSKFESFVSDALRSCFYFTESYDCDSGFEVYDDACKKERIDFERSLNEIKLECSDSVLSKDSEDCIRYDLYENRNIETCDLFDETRSLDKCISFLSNFEDVCDEITDLELKMECKFRWAFLKQNFSFCYEEIDNSDALVSCLVLMGENKTEIDSFVEESKQENNRKISTIVADCQNNSECIIGFAGKYLDHNYCLFLPDEDNDQQRIVADCFSLLAIMSMDNRYCLKSNNNYYENYCQIMFDRYVLGDMQLEREDFISKYTDLN